MPLAMARPSPCVSCRLDRARPLGAGLTINSGLGRSGDEMSNRYAVSERDALTGLSRLQREAVLCVRDEGGRIIGRDAREVSAEDLARCGHDLRSRPAAIRVKCLDCSGGSPTEVSKCTAIDCALWPYRMGCNPFAAARSGRVVDDALRERLRVARLAKRAR